MLYELYLNKVVIKQKKFLQTKIGNTIFVLLTESME